MIKCIGIYKGYGEVEVLKNIDLELLPGKITVLIGPSGSGKTTLLRVTSLIDNPAKGRITIDNKSYDFPNEKPIRDQFGFDGKQTLGVVFQNLNLIPHWNNRQNILKPIEKHTWNKSRLDELIELLKLESFLDKYPHQCSRGEQQRIAIVRALMLNPKFLFLDEITSALDPELIAAVFKYLLRLKDEGVGIFLVTHFLLFAQNVADKILFIQGGEIFEQGGKEIMKHPKTEKLKIFLESLNGFLISN